MENAGSLICWEFVKVELVITEAMAEYNMQRLRVSIRDEETALLCEANPEAMADKILEGTVIYGLVWISYDRAVATQFI